MADGWECESRTTPMLNFGRARKFREILNSTQTRKPLELRCVVMPAASRIICAFLLLVNFVHSKPSFYSLPAAHGNDAGFKSVKKKARSDTARVVFIAGTPTCCCCRGGPLTCGPLFRVRVCLKRFVSWDQASVERDIMHGSKYLLKVNVSLRCRHRK